MAAAAPLRLVTALHAAAREAGWTVDAVSPAEGAWCAAAAALWPASARHASYLLVCSEDRTELLQIEQGRLSGVRRFRAGAADSVLVAEAIGQERPREKTSATAAVAVVGLSAPRRELARALAASGLTVSPAPPEWTEAADFPDLLAAEFAGPKAAPLLRSDATLASRHQRGRKMIANTMMAAVVLLLLSAVFALWGARHQLRAVQAERALIRPRISATLVGRTSVETAFRQLSTLAAAERSATRWSHVIARLSDHLDDSAYLTSLRGREDSVVVEGVAVRASRAFDTMAATPGLTNVRAAAPVRRESPTGGPAMERFAIAAVVVTRVAPAPPTAAPKAAP
jgi:Tfp pilus assembly protein PilN